MLILLPPSRTMKPVRGGRPLDLGSLSFPELKPTRATVLHALIQVSARADATRHLLEPESMAAAVGRNTEIARAPTVAAERLYAGVLYEALGLDDLESAARRRARSCLVIVSALWGAVRPTDRLPAYRLGMCGRLPGLAHLTEVWREPLGAVLPAAARRGLIVDCRSSEYATAWRPKGTLADRTVLIKIVRHRDGVRSAASHSAKHTRGLVARTIITDGMDPRRPEDLAAALSVTYELELSAPARTGRPWQLNVLEPSG